MTGRILIADQLASNRILLTARLSAAHYVVEVAETGASVLQIARASPPDLMILDERLPDITGIEVCRRLKTPTGAPRVPVILLTETNSEDDRLAALDAGADEFLPKPVDEVTLMARVRSILRARETQEALDRRRVTVEDLGFAEAATSFRPAARVAFVSTTPAEAKTWRDGLGGLTRTPIEILSPDAALAPDALGNPPDLYLIEADLRGGRDGLRLLCELRSRPTSRHAAIIVLHGAGDADTAAMALDLGASDILAHGFQSAELAIRIRTQVRRKQDADRLRASVEDGLRLAVTDPLTDLYNRRYALSHLRRMNESAQQTGRPYAVLMMDIDHFKSVNDSHGHAAGDSVLRHVAGLLQDNLRPIDLVARHGGEEFLIGIPETTAEDAEATGERLRRLIAASPSPLADARAAVTVTVSVGLAMSNDVRADQPVEAIMELADEALYAAKNKGRNTLAIAKAKAA